MNLSDGRVIRIGTPVKIPAVQNNSFLRRLHELEDRKMDLFMKGAFYFPEMMDEVSRIEQKLEKYYSWYARAYVAGKV